MAGAFDFYVDEDLLRQLLGDDTEKPKSNGKNGSSAAPAHSNGAGNKSPEPRLAEAQPHHDVPEDIRIAPDASPSGEVAAAPEFVPAGPALNGTGHYHDVVELLEQADEEKVEVADAVEEPAVAEILHADPVEELVEESEDVEEIALADSELISEQHFAEPEAEPVLVELESSDVVIEEVEAETAEEATPVLDEVEPQQDEVSPEIEAATPVFEEAVPVRAWAHADHLFAALDFKNAAEAYSIAAEENPSHAATLYYNSGLAYFTDGSFNLAQESFLKALDHAPESNLALLGLGSALLESGDDGTAKECFEQVLSSTAPGAEPDLDALHGLIRCSLRLREFDAAEDACRKVLAIVQNDAAVLEVLTGLLVTKQDIEGASSFAATLLETQPRSIIALQTLIWAAVENENPALAAGFCDTLIELGESSSAMLLQMAGIYKAAGEPGKAVRAAQMALDLQPETADEMIQLGECLESLESFDDALRAFELASAIEPHRTDLEIRVAALHEERGHYEQAVQSLEKCLETRPAWPEALFQLGHALCELGQTERGQEQMLKAIALKPEISWIEHLERLAIERNDSLVALECHERLAEADAETSEMAYNVGVVLQSENEAELAAKCYIRALEKKPDFSDALLNLGHALRDLGREDEARACWSKAIQIDPALAAGYFD
jgi:tetratricopeptide (TPR) repeat protein